MKPTGYYTHPACRKQQGHPGRPPRHLAGGPHGGGGAPAADAGGGADDEPPRLARSAADGVFRIEGVPDGRAFVDALAPVAKELGVVVPVSIFERDGPAYYNSVVIIDADGKQLGVYRKSHIPDGPGYQEKYYFRPGDTGYRVWSTKHARIGVGICWDQWFPECARAMALTGGSSGSLASPTR